MRRESGSPNPIPFAFFAITFAWAWGFWLIPLATTRGWILSPKLSALRVFLLVIGAYAPFVSAFVLSFREGMAAALFKRAFRWKFPIPVIVIAVFLSPVLAGCAVWVRSLQRGAPFAVQVGLRDAVILLFFLFFLGGSFNEEFGWAYAIDRIQPRWGFVNGSLLLGCVWACWHLPLFFMPTQSQSHMPFWSFLLMCCSFRLLYVWAYNNAQQSVLATMIFHTSVNFTLNLFALLNPKIPALRQATWIYYTILLMLSAATVGYLGNRKRVF